MVRFVDEDFHDEVGLAMAAAQASPQAAMAASGVSLC
jgi:hypothetical protein